MDPRADSRAVELVILVQRVRAPSRLHDKRQLRKALSYRCRNVFGAGRYHIHERALEFHVYADREVADGQRQA